MEISQPKEAFQVPHLLTLVNNQDYYRRTPYGRNPQESGGASAFSSVKGLEGERGEGLQGEAGWGSSQDSSGKKRF